MKEQEYLFCTKEDIAEYIKSEKQKLSDAISEKIKIGKTRPKLLIVQVGDNAASNKYVGGKIKDCNEVGIEATLMKFPKSITYKELENFLDKDSFMYNAVIVQKPTNEEIDARFGELIGHIHPMRDVDGFRVDSIFNPCTPKGIVDYIEDRRGKEWLDGKDVVIINRTDLVGRPLARMLLDRHATVTVCHSHTKRLKEKCFNADIIVSAIGKPHFIKDDYVSIGTTCIDVGISFKDGKMCGDFDREKVSRNTPYCTPVPCGVGLLTRLALLKNTFDAAYNISGSYMW